MTAIVPDQVLGLLRQLWRSTATMHDQIVEHVATRALTPELKRDLVRLTRSHIRQEPLSVLLDILGHSLDSISLVSVSRDC